MPSYQKTQQVKGKRKKSKTQSNRKKLIKELDDLIRQIIKKRDSKCFTCGSDVEDIGYFSKENPLGLQVGHYVGRKKYALRWNLKNVHAQCTFCNGKHRFDELPYTVALAEKYGKGIFKEFMYLRENHKSLNLGDLRDIKSELEKMV